MKGIYGYWLFIALALALVLTTSGCSAAGLLPSGGTANAGTGGSRTSPSETPPSKAQQSQTANPPVSSATAEIPSSSSAPVTAGWKTYTSESLQVAVDYPPDWMVSEEAAGTAFTPPIGANILLSPVDTGGLTLQQYLDAQQLPNTRCTPGTNPHQISLVTCFDTIARSTTTYFILSGKQGTQRIVTLTVGRGGDMPVFEAMVASLRTLSS